MKRAVSLLLLAAACQPAAPEPLDHSEPFAVFSPESLAERLTGDGRTGPFELSGPTLRVGVLWDAVGPSSLEGRFSNDGRSFGPWHPLTVVFDETRSHAGHLDVPWGSTSLQLRVQGEVSFLSLEEIHELGEPDAAPLEPLPPVARARQALAPFPTILSRAAWGARAPTCSSPTTPSRAAIHHSVSPTNDATPAEQRLRQIQAFHMDSRGYCDVGYNFLMTRDARVWTGRGATVLGGHAANANGGNVGICVVGTYTTDQPTTQQMCAGAGFLAWLHATYNVPLNRTAMKGHREYGQTACPGDALFGRLNELVMLASNGCGGPPPTPAWRAEFVSQSFPGAHVGAVTLTQGDFVDGFVELRNTGTQTWTTAATRLAPTPRDQPSPLGASTWLTSNRVSGPPANTPPGQVARFPARLQGNSVGAFTQTFGLLHENTAWFSDPGQGGPADTFITVRVNVVPRPPPPPPPDAGSAADAGAPPPVDAGSMTPPPDAGPTTPPDAGPPPAVDAGEVDAGADVDGGAPEAFPGDEADTGGEERIDDVIGGCSAAPMGALASLALLGRLRRRRAGW
ncbi:MAG: N-acetylmuramoyl-L-alanine amidase [Myxococcaceae bacterium]|nr:N-acetylmuramoyl-L-alanine amidase [Myxococcaceae bacterium]MCA3011102.1 N-acetylmuramoyl-L-alanine amidase [Myxococcaceae bacterium]